MYMINTRGSVRAVDSNVVEYKKRDGWIVLPLSQLNEVGEPRQKYYPQYDNSKGDSMTVLTEEGSPKDILETELL